MHLPSWKIIIYKRAGFGGIECSNPFHWIACQGKIRTKGQLFKVLMNMSWKYWEHTCIQYTHMYIYIYYCVYIYIDMLSGWFSGKELQETYSRSNDNQVRITGFLQCRNTRLPGLHQKKHMVIHPD